MTAIRGLAELVRQGGIPISRAPRRLRETPVRLSKDRLVELEALLHLRDGFRTLGGALILRPSVTVAAVRGIEDWNQLSLWRTPYRHASEILFFADDILGHQFGLLRDEVVRFEPETGVFEHFAFTLDRWAERLLEDPDEVGRSLVRAWEADHKPLQVNERLQPEIPFILSESEDVAFRVTEDLELMRKYARLFRETRQFDDGTTIDIPWWLEPSQ